MNNNPFGAGLGGPGFGGLGGAGGGFPGVRPGGDTVGPNDPLFNQHPGGNKENAGDQTSLPKGSVPPGAHYDPLTPFDNRGTKHTAGPDKDEARPPNFTNQE